MGFSEILLILMLVIWIGSFLYTEYRDKKYFDFWKEYKGKEDSNQEQVGFKRSVPTNRQNQFWPIVLYVKK